MKAIFDCARAEFAHKKRQKRGDLTPQLRALTDFESALRGFSSKITYLCTDVHPLNWRDTDYNLKRTLQGAVHSLFDSVPDLQNHPILDVPDTTPALQQVLAEKLYRHVFQFETRTASTVVSIYAHFTSAEAEAGVYYAHMDLRVSISEDGITLTSRAVRAYTHVFKAPEAWTLRKAYELFTYATNSLHSFRKISVTDWLTEFEPEVKKARADRALGYAARRAFEALPRDQRKWILDNTKTLATEYRFSLD